MVKRFKREIFRLVAGNNQFVNNFDKVFVEFFLCGECETFCGLFVLFLVIFV